MSITARTVRIPLDFYKKAQAKAKAKNRSTSAQVHYWAKIGKIAEDNPDLPVSFIKDILVGLEQAEAGEVYPYQFENGK